MLNVSNYMLGLLQVKIAKELDQHMIKNTLGSLSDGFVCRVDLDTYSWSISPLPAVLQTGR